VRTLEEAGYIQGYRGSWIRAGSGFDVTVFASVHLSSQAEADLRAFENSCAPSRWCGSAGCCRRGRLHPEMRARDMATFQDFVTNLTAAPHVATSEHRWCCTIRNTRRPCRSM